MKTFVLCGGEGTRLKPYTYYIPKPMLLIGGKPILWYVLQNLKKNGLTDLILTVGYKREQIQEYFKNGKEFGISIQYAVEEEALNTAGSILPQKDMIDSTFAVVMGDHLTNINLRKMIDAHKKSKAIATIALLRGRVALEYGVAEVKNNEVVGFEEKPFYEKLYNVAIYLFEPKIFEYIKPKEDFAKNVFPRLLQKKERINAYLFDETWFDVGRVSDYERLNEQFRAGQLLKDVS
jgi:NDP-sugar pyrophosphorylase family protein